MSDLKLESRSDGLYDLAFENGDLQLGKSLENSVIVSIGSDSRIAEKKFSGKLADDGWWGEPSFENDLWGSRLFTILKRKKDGNALLLAEQYVKKSLQWMIDDGVVESVDVDVGFDNASLLLNISLSKKSEKETFKYEFAWNEVA